MKRLFDCTVFCSLRLKIAKVCARPRKGIEMGGMDCSSGKKRTQSFTHGLDELVGKSRVGVWYSWRWKEEGRINWYPWGVQIYGYELAVARVGPRVGRML